MNQAGHQLICYHVYLKDINAKHCKTQLVLICICKKYLVTIEKVNSISCKEELYS